MTEEKEQILQNYYEQFKTNEWAYFLIPKLNPNSVTDENISIILESNIKNAPLKSVISFLKKKFSKKYKKASKCLAVKRQASKTEIACQLVKFVVLSHPCSKESDTKTQIEDKRLEEESDSGDERRSSSAETEYTPESDSSDEDYCPSSLKANRKTFPSTPTPTKDEETVINKSPQMQNEEIEYAEEALTSPTLTPYQPQPKENQTLKEKSDHELTQLIESVPDVFNNDWKMKEIVEKIKRVSISKDQEDERNILKPKIKRKKLPRKGMQHRKKSEIINENEKLNEIIKDITKKNTSAENKIKELEKQLQNEQMYQERMEKLEEKLKNQDSASLQKQIYEAEAVRHTQEKKINDMQVKIEEQRKKHTEKQNEIKELKKQDEKNLSEINTLKTALEKETDLRTKAESLLNLTEEKLEAQVMIYNQEKENSSAKTQEIETLRQRIKTQDEIDDNHRIVTDEYDREIRNLKSQISENEIYASSPNIMKDNRHMAAIIDKLENQTELYKDEIHNLSVKLVEANIEINVRKKVIDEINKAHYNHLEQISDAYLEKCGKYQKEAEEKAKKELNCKKGADRKTKNNEKDGPENSELETLKYELLEKNKQVESLTAELQRIGEEKYNEITKSTQPTPRRQGIPNTYTNGCFMIAPMHTLATCIETKTIENNEEIVNIHIK